MNMADYRFNIDIAPPTVLRTEPDLHLLKQVEQVTKFALEGPPRRFTRLPSMGITGAVKVLVLPILRSLAWLLFRCKEQQKQPGAEGNRLRRRSPASCQPPPRLHG